MEEEIKDLLETFWKRLEYINERDKRNSLNNRLEIKKIKKEIKALKAPKSQF